MKRSSNVALQLRKRPCALRVVFDSVCNQATRRGLLKQGFALAAGSAIAGVSMFTAEPAKAASAPRTFSDVVDLTHPLFEGFEYSTARNGSRRSHF